MHFGQDFYGSRKKVLCSVALASPPRPADLPGLKPQRQKKRPFSGNKIKYVVDFIMEREGERAGSSFAVQKRETQWHNGTCVAATYYAAKGIGERKQGSGAM